MYFLHFDNARRLIAVLVLTLSLVGCVWGQDPVRCKGVARIRSSPEYKIGNRYRTLETKALEFPPTAVVYISIKPQFVVRDHLLALAQQLKADYCGEKRLMVLIFDDHRAASEFMSGTEPTKRDLPALRGTYFMDRASREEYIEYSPNRNKPQEQLRVDLANHASTQ